MRKTTLPFAVGTLALATVLVSHLVPVTSSAATDRPAEPVVPSTESKKAEAFIRQNRPKPARSATQEQWRADYEKGFGPTFISTGTRDLFLGHCSRLQRRVTDAGIGNRLFVHEGMRHVFQILAIPEAEAAWLDLASFFDRHLAR